MLQTEPDDLTQTDTQSKCWQDFYLERPDPVRVEEPLVLINIEQAGVSHQHRGVLLVYLFIHAD